MTDNVLLKNLVSYEFTANVVKVDVCTRVSKKTGYKYMAPIVVLGNVCLADTGQLIAEYYYLYYGKSLAKLGELDLNTEIGFIAKPDLRTLGNEMNNDIAPLIAWPRNFKIIDGSTPLGKVPTDEKLLVGYINL
ncbi:hypothetical protein [Ligilactobacillus salivarius]|uniref:hypothetical protein n=1 Tax=Ligilactobacillus salivarius TaxID=1624 RepID=UPI001CDAEB4E|nr:hypothetical protein [Ligilactobacillus salivarius]